MSDCGEKNPIHICFILPKAYPLFDVSVEGIFGGAEVDIYYLATEIAKDDDFKVSFITADYGQEQERKIENVRLIKSLSFKENAAVGAMRIWKAMKHANADVYMLKTASPGVPLAAAFCGFHRKVFVYRMAHRRECDGSYMNEHPVLGRAFACSLRKAAMVFVQNASDKDEIKKTIGVDSVVIPNGHRLPQVSEGEQDSILWVGRSAEFKRPEKFIDLAKKFPDDKFVMVCRKATETDNNCYERLCDKIRGVRNIEFHQQVAFENIGGFFGRAKILVNTSQSEGFANTFIQAGIYARSILSLNVNPDGFLGEFSCGLSCDDDENKLAEGLKYMLNKQRYIELGRNARKYVEGKHDIKKIAERYKEIFTELKHGMESA